MPEALVIHHRQRTRVDCGIAALAGLLRLPYRAVREAVDQVNPRGARNGRGLYLREIETTALILGYELLRRPRGSYDPDRDTGLIGLRGFGPNGGDIELRHFALLVRGLIVETDGTIWPWRDYLEYCAARLCTLSVLSPEQTS